MRYFIWKLELVSNILWMVVDHIYNFTRVMATAFGRPGALLWRNITNKITWLFNHVGYQTWQGGSFWLNDIYKIIQSTGDIDISGHIKIKKILYLHFHETCGHETSHDDGSWQEVTNYNVTSPFDNVITRSQVT